MLEALLWIAVGIVIGVVYHAKLDTYTRPLLLRMWERISAWLKFGPAK